MISKTIINTFLTLYMAILNVAADEVLTDAKLNFTELALKYGMECKEYDVTTEDGYILKLFRIPGNKTRPVLFMHGMLESADSVILRGQKSIVAFVSNAGYDIWAGNFRGNKYSRRHVTLNPDTDVAFWDFTMHEHGVYDLSASIDFILNETKVNHLSLIGHSEGSMIMFVLGSLRPEYNDKINIFMASAPTCHFENIVTRIPWILNFATILRTILLSFNIEEIMSHDSAISVLQKDFCGRLPQICLTIMNTVLGYDPDGVDVKFMRILVGHFPAGTSRKNLEHFYQVMLSRRFAQYDYGLSKNLAKYNSPKPPLYNLRKVTVKVALFIAENDNLSTQKDGSTLKKQLPNVVFYKLIENASHAYFAHGQHAYKIVYPSVIKLLRKYNT